MELEEQIARSGELAASTAHPEEMKANVNVRIGKYAVLTASARMTPAGMISIGVAVALFLFSTAAVVRAAWRPRR